MQIIKAEDAVKEKNLITGLFYCAPGVGKSTAISIFANCSEERTLVLDVDRTFTNALRLMGDAVDTSKIDVVAIDNVHTYKDWTDTLVEIDKMLKEGHNWGNVAVDNISELERCILSDLGSQGKNKGVPAQADYQYMQFKLVNSLRFMKSWGVDVFWTAWETIEQFQNPDGSNYSRRFPKISAKIVDNICGLCDVVARIHVNSDGKRGLILEATQNVYAKNQLDDRKVCKIEDFISNNKED